MNRYDFALGRVPEKEPEDDSIVPADLKDVWEHFKPKTLEESVHFLVKMYANNLLFTGVALLTEDEFIGRCHHGIGAQIRNDWGLWQDSYLAMHFKEMGIQHADDMSGIILTSTYREITGQIWDLVGQIKHYKDYWAEAENMMLCLEIQMVRTGRSSGRV